MNFHSYNFLKKYDLRVFEEKTKIYKNLLQKFNRIHSLTSLKNIDNNILDSIKILDFYSFDKVKSIADIGSGAGFPAVFLAFLLKSNFHLFEPNAKKAAFLTMLKIECDLPNLNIYKEKVQECNNNIKVDIITSRALMDIKSLLEICKNLRDKKSIFILWKGGRIYKELKDIKNYQILYFKVALRLLLYFCISAVKTISTKGHEIPPCPGAASLKAFRALEAFLNECRSSCPLASKLLSLIL